MEIVSRPDLRSAEEAAEYLRKMRSILRYLGTCDGNMEEGSMRADVNVSVRKPGANLGTRCEIKNINSIALHRAGGRVRVAPADRDPRRRAVPSSRKRGMFDSRTGETRSMRSKKRPTTIVTSQTPIFCRS
jgi:aspartyl-tRNA(Asn)/glutamyl-tRNA(Gln) amidotransferase subunit B